MRLHDVLEEAVEGVRDKINLHIIDLRRQLRLAADGREALQECVMDAERLKPHDLVGQAVLLALTNFGDDCRFSWHHDGALVAVSKVRGHKAVFALNLWNGRALWESSWDFGGGALEDVI